jgi:hypothetical protein
MEITIDPGEYDYGEMAIGLVNWVASEGLGAISTEMARVLLESTNELATVGDLFSQKTEDAINNFFKVYSDDNETELYDFNKELSGGDENSVDLSFLADNEGKGLNLNAYGVRDFLIQAYNLSEAFEGLDLNEHFL